MHVRPKCIRCGKPATIFNLRVLYALPLMLIRSLSRETSSGGFVENQCQASHTLDDGRTETFFFKVSLSLSLSLSPHARMHKHDDDGVRLQDCRRWGSFSVHATFTIWLAIIMTKYYCR